MKAEAIDRIKDLARKPYGIEVGGRMRVYRPEPDGGWKADEPSRRLVLVAVLDNLLKGAAGQAVQNLNLMLGLDERTGLEFGGLHPL